MLFSHTPLPGFSLLPSFLLSARFFFKVFFPSLPNTSHTSSHTHQKYQRRHVVLSLYSLGLVVYTVQQSGYCRIANCNTSPDICASRILDGNTCFVQDGKTARSPTSLSQCGVSSQENCPGHNSDHQC